MRVDIITVLPELIRSPFEGSMMKRAIDKGLVEVHFHNLRDYSTNKQKSVDDYHDQLAKEYQAGISLSNLAKAMGLSSAAPLYYGVQRSLQRTK